MEPDLSVSSPPDTEAVRANLMEFLARRARISPEPAADLFATGTLSSLFALELVMHLESAFEVTIGAEDLRLDNFRTVDSMTGLVLRLRSRTGG